MIFELERTDYGAASSTVGPKAKASEASLFTRKTGAKVLLLRSLGGGSLINYEMSMSSDQSLGALPEELNIGSNIPHDPTPTHMSGGYMESQALFYNLRVYRNSS